MDIGGVTFGARYYATLRRSHLRISDSDGGHVLRPTISQKIPNLGVEI